MISSHMELNLKAFYIDVIKENCIETLPDEIDPSS
jgi:hypothetical protein